KHLRQVEMYAINEGVDWGILTNGDVWQVYHLAPRAENAQPGPLVEVDLTLEVSLLGDEQPAKKLEKLFCLTKEAMQKRRPLEEMWRQQRATSPKVLARVLQTAPVLDAI